MGIVILIVIIVGTIGFFNSYTFQSWKRRQWEQQMQEEARARSAQIKKDLCNKGTQFSKSIVSNHAVKAMADSILQAAKEMMSEEIHYARNNIETYNVSLLVTDFSIQKQSFDPKCKGYIPDYADKSGFSLSFSDYGIQMSKETYKVYGLALALESLITSQKLSFPEEVKIFKIHANIHNWESPHPETTLSLSWTIEQHKFIEL